MNDFELKLSQQPFRTPPADLRGAIVGSPAHLIVPARWTWRDWFWPSPQAWAALVAIWAILYAIELPEHRRARATEASRDGGRETPAEALQLFALERERVLGEVMKGSPSFRP